MGIGAPDLVDYYIGLERRVARLERTSTLGNNQTDTTFVGTLAVTGLTLASQTVVAYGTDFQVYMNFSWSAVSQDANIITDDKVVGYYTSFTKNGTNWTAEQFTDGTTATVGPLAQGQTITFRVRAVTTKNTYGAYSTLSQTSTLDSSAPGQPSTPTGAPYLGQVRLFWDGKQVGGSAMPTDLVVCEVHMSTTSITFTATSATLIDVFYPGGGYMTITDLPYGTTHYFRLVAVDKVGNRSPSSTGVGVVPVQAVDGDIASMSIGKLTVGNLSADMTVAARIKTANTGARVELNSSGLQAYNSSNVLTVNISAATGNAAILGTFTTGTTGQRIVIDASGNGTIYFYPATGTDFSFINAPNSNTVGINAAIGTGFNTRCYLTPTAGFLEYVSQPAQANVGGQVFVNSGSATMQYATSSNTVSANSGGAALNSSGGANITVDTSGNVTANGGGDHFYQRAGSQYLTHNSGGSEFKNVTSSVLLTGSTVELWGVVKIPSGVTTANAPNMYLLPSSGQIYYNNSSRTIKEEIQDLDSEGLIEGIKQLRPRTFYDKNDYAEVDGDTDLLQRLVGLISEEVHEIDGPIGSLLSRWDAGPDGELHRGVQYSTGWVTLIPAIQMLLKDYEERHAA